jgi:hypothetical protein
MHVALELVAVNALARQDDGMKKRGLSSYSTPVGLTYTGSVNIRQSEKVAREYPGSSSNIVENWYNRYSGDQPTNWLMNRRSDIATRGKKRSTQS